MTFPGFHRESGCALCHGVLHGQQGSILLILHLHKPGCPGCHYIVLRYHGCNIVSIDPHPGIEKFSVRNILMGRFHGPWMAGCGELDVRHIEARNNLHYPRHLPCFFQIKAFLPRRWRWCCVLPLPPEDPVALNRLYTWHCL